MGDAVGDDDASRLTTDDSDDVDYYEDGLNWDYDDITTNSPRVQTITIWPYDPTPSLSSWLELGRAIGRNTHLRRVSICPDGVPDDDDLADPTNWEAFFREFARNRSITSLELEEVPWRVELATQTWLERLHPFVIENHNLINLGLHTCGLGVQDIEGLATTLSQRGAAPPLKRIDITEPSIRHDLVRAIVELTDSCPQLKKLRVGHYGLNAEACAELASLLENPNKRSLKCLDVSLNSINDDGVRVLADAVATSTTLRVLALNYCDSITAAGWGRILEVLCNTTSINATYLSNHTLERMWNEDDRRSSMNLPNDLLFCLKQNKHPNKAWVARKKIIRFHLSGDFSLAPFREMDLELLPSVLGWVGKEHWCPLGLSAFYRILKNFPDLCNFPSHERRMRLQVEAENALLRSDNFSLKDQVERLQAEIAELRSNKRPRSG